MVEVKAANLFWQLRPDLPALLTEILDWYDYVTGDVDRLLTVQAADVQACASAPPPSAPAPARTGSVGSDQGALP